MIARISRKDPFTPKERSRVMSAVASFDTEPELLLRKALWSRGMRYRLKRRIAGTRPDMVFVGAKLAVFVDGCFWHGCKRHYVAPVGNAELWQRKLNKNQARDRRNNEALADAGWKVVRVWECDVRTDPNEAAVTIEGVLRNP